MDALKNIAANVPDWLKKLDDLGSQIEQRQVDLAGCADSASLRAPSLRNRGSTESLKPKDEDADATGAGPARPARPARPSKPPLAALPEIPSAPAAMTSPTTCQPTKPPTAQDPKAMPPPAPRQLRTKQARQLKPKSASVASINLDDATTTVAPVPRGTARTMIIVYYDSYVQTFFEDLVKFVFLSRNFMRKAKMAAKVAQIKKMAEDEFDAEDSANSNGVPPFRLPPSRRAASRYGPTADNLKDQFSDIYSQLDEHLEFVQTTSEKAAHQFLREGDCDNEIAKIQQRLRTALELVRVEMDKMLKENPKLEKEGPDGGRARTHRPPSMRRDPSKRSTEQLAAGMGSAAVSESVASSTASKRLLGNNSIIEAADEADEGIEVDYQPAKIQYRSTRGLRRT